LGSEEQRLVSSLTIRVITSKYPTYTITVPERYRQTDIQTDRQTLV